MRPQKTFTIAALVLRAFWLSLLSFCPALLVAITWVLFHDPATGPAISTTPAQPNLAGDFVREVILGPLVETAILHLLVIESLLKFNLRKTIHIVPITAVIFVAIHLTNPNGLASAVAVIPGGFVLAYCYWYWRRKTGSWRVASTATWMTHGLHNFYYWLLNFVPAWVIFG
jgi:hypothetical protein